MLVGAEVLRWNHGIILRSSAVHSTALFERKGCKAGEVVTDESADEGLHSPCAGRTWMMGTVTTASLRRMVLWMSMLESILFSESKITGSA